LGSFKLQPKQGKVEVNEVEDKLERIESYERKLEALYARFDTFERLSSRDRSGNGESRALGSEQQGNNGQKAREYNKTVGLTELVLK